MITKFDINRFEIQSNIGKCSRMDDHLDICRVFEISKFDIARLTCTSISRGQYYFNIALVLQNE